MLPRGSVTNSIQLDKPFCQPFGNRRLVHCTNSTSSSPPTSASDHRLRKPPVPLEDHNLDNNDDYEYEYQHKNNHPPPSVPPSRNSDSNPHSVGETPAWESCGRIVAQERADFYEFIACNILFAFGAVVIVYVRSRRLHALHARTLAARIGLIRR